MIQLSIATASAAAAEQSQAGDTARSSCSNPSDGAGRRVTTKEVGGDLGPPRHELKPDNETSTRFHRHKASAMPADVGLVN